MMIVVEAGIDGEVESMYKSFLNGTSIDFYDHSVRNGIVWCWSVDSDK